MGSQMLEMVQKVVKSVDNITTRSCETLQLGSLCLTASRADRIEIRCPWPHYLRYLRKQPQEMQTGEQCTHTHGLFVHVSMRW